MVGEGLEIWVRLNGDEEPLEHAMADRIWSEQDNPSHLHLNDGLLSSADGMVAVHLVLSDGTDQSKGISLMGSVDWLVVESVNWSMIPLENLIAARTGSHTKIAAVLSAPLQAQGAGFALQEGVDALVIPNDPRFIEAALSVQAQRHESSVNQATLPGESLEDLTLSTLRVVSVEEAGVGDRYCLDVLSLLAEGEGFIVGSSASCMVLVHSETIPSTYVPTRPFRVNAGSPHSYIMMEDASTKYLADLCSGDRLLAVTSQGTTRGVTLGRLKIEQRPMLKITVTAEPNNERKAKESHVYMQQAETVRLVSQLAQAHSVTDLKEDDRVLGWLGHEARHLGKPISGLVEER